jgi:hypothetical protein
LEPIKNGRTKWGEVGRVCESVWNRFALGIVEFKPIVLDPSGKAIVPGLIVKLVYDFELLFFRNEIFKKHKSRAEMGKLLVGKNLACFHGE